MMASSDGGEIFEQKRNAFPPHYHGGRTFMIVVVMSQDLLTMPLICHRPTS
jgi:hypothetical protein